MRIYTDIEWVIVTQSRSNNALQRRPRSKSLIVLPLPFAAPLNASVGRRFVKISQRNCWREPEGSGREMPPSFRGERSARRGREASSRGNTAARQQACLVMRSPR
jgi:hypothetical protein